MLRKVQLLHKVSRQTFGIHKLTLPAFSPTMEQGKIIEWRVKEGDEVEEGDSLAQIETDKASLEFEVFDSMVIAKILKGPEDGLIKVGDVIAYCVDDVDELKDFKVPNSDEQVNTQQESKQEEVKDNDDIEDNDSQNYPEFIRIDMPALSPTMEDGKILQWNVEVGQEVEAGDCLASLETDKATLDFENQDDGFVAKILQQADGNRVKVGEPLVILVQEKEDVEKFKNFTLEDLQKKNKPSGQKNKKTENEALSQVYKQKEEQNLHSEKQKVNQSNDNKRIFISPLAKRLAAEYDYDITQMNGSGPNGRIIKKDVDNYKPQKQDTKSIEKSIQKKEAKKQQKQQQTLDLNNYVEIPVTGMRKVIAERLTLSKREIPHYYVETKVNMDSLIEFRKTVNSQSTTKISVSDFIIKAVAKTNKEVPEANQQWHGDKIKSFDNVDVGFAVDIGNGLITPIVKKAEQKTISQIAFETKELIEKAKQNKLKPDEYQGGTITISNLGMMGVNSFSAIINPPQSCILAISSSVKQPEYNPENPDQINWVTKMSVTLSCDHRVVDGAIAAKWLQTFKKYMEKPMLLIVQFNF